MFSRFPRETRSFFLPGGGTDGHGGLIVDVVLVEEFIEFDFDELRLMPGLPLEDEVGDEEDGSEDGDEGNDGDVADVMDDVLFHCYLLFSQRGNS